MKVPWALAALAVALASEQSVCSRQGSSKNCRSDDFQGPFSKVVRLEDCFMLNSECLSRLNDTAGHDEVPYDTVMAMFEKVGHEGLFEKAVIGSAWEERFAARHCKHFEALEFPETASALLGLGRRFEELRRATGGEIILVHADSLQDGIGARFKKAVEFVAAALQIGFDAVALALPPAGSLLHPDWEYGPVWCHESPARGPERQHPGSPEYPLACWRLELQADLLGQSPEPEGRQLLWGSRSEAIQSPRHFHCFHFDAGEGKLESAAWNFFKRHGLRREELSRLFTSVRTFSAPGQILQSRREALCGFGGPADIKHVAIHVRRGDVGILSGYAVTQQLGSAGFSRWICALVAALGAEASSSVRFVLHVYTEAAGTTLAALRRVGLEGFSFEPSASEDQRVFHTLASLEVSPTCSDLLLPQVSPTCSDLLLPQVHVIVNNNPREVLLCM
ncbi:unnamed protein product, partial [Polarella glacialis]